MNKLSKQNSSPQLHTLGLSIPSTPKRELDETGIFSPRRYDEELLNSGRSTLNNITNLTDFPLSKFYSFKKIRELKVRQRNEQGKVVIQVRLSNQNQQLLRPMKERITDLHDIKTISSKYSPRSSDNSPAPSVVESHIICKGQQVFQSSEFKRKFEMGEFGFRRRKNFSKVFHPQLDLFIVNEVGWLCHYQIVTYPIQESLIKLFRQICHQNLLTLYAQHPLPNFRCLLMYQPYQLQFQSYIKRACNLHFGDIIKYFTQIVSQLRAFRDRGFYPYIDSECVVISQEKVKLKIQKTRIAGNERDLLKDIGGIGFETLGIMRGNRGIKNLNKQRRVNFESLMEDLISGCESSLEDAFVRLSVL